MADIRLVIDISEELYQMCRSRLGDADCIESAIANGTRIPKGRGRMIIVSEDAVKGEQQMPLSFSRQKWISEVGLSNATVAIIDAESEEE